VVKDIIKKKFTELIQGETLAVVTHAGFLKGFTAEKIEDNKFFNCKAYKNCEVGEYQI